MAGNDRRFWDAYWAGQPATLTARAVAHVLDRMKLEHLQSVFPGGAHS